MTSLFWPASYFAVLTPPGQASCFLRWPRWLSSAESDSTAAATIFLPARGNTRDPGIPPQDLSNPQKRSHRKTQKAVFDRIGESLPVDLPFCGPQLLKERSGPADTPSRKAGHIRPPNGPGQPLTEIYFMNLRSTFVMPSLAAIVTIAGLAQVSQAQCLLGRLFNRPTTYAAGYGGYPVGVAYTPVTTYMPVLAPTVGSPVTAYRVTYLPATPGATTVYRVAPAISPPIISSTSYLPVATPYAVSPSAQGTAVVPVVTYRPVQIVYEPRRLFRWRPFANLRARRLGYAAGPTWTTAYFASYSYLPVSTTSVVCAPESSLPLTAASPALEGTTSGCLSCAAPAVTSQGSAAYTVPSLPATTTPAPSQPTPTFKQDSDTSGTETRLKPPEESKSGPSASGTSVPVSEDRPLVRQALYEKPIPLVDDEGDPPMVDVQGWRRAR